MFMIHCIFPAAEIPGNYDYILVNDDLDMAYKEFQSIINKVR